jgi:nitrate/nitrite transporter NarK
VSNIFGSARLGVLTGTVSMVHQIAGGVGALTGAAIYDRFDTYNPAFSLMLLVAVAALAVTLTVREWRAEPKGSAEGRAPLP